MTRHRPASLRHHWVHVRAGAHEAVTGTCRDPAQRATVAAWLAAGHPLILRSAAPEHPAGFLAAGLALPPAQGKARIALAVAEDAVAAIEAPPELERVAAALPGPFAQLASRIAAGARRIGFVARAYGSAAWQWRSGHPYMARSSDLDVLAAPPHRAMLGAWIGLLDAAEREIGVRIDGEIQGPDGRAVHWRECSGLATQVLMKEDAGASLRARTEWEAAWLS